MAQRPGLRRSHLLTLPQELRDNIYTYLRTCTSQRSELGFTTTLLHLHDSNLLCICQQIYNELLDAEETLMRGTIEVESSNNRIQAARQLLWASEASGIVKGQLGRHFDQVKQCELILPADQLKVDRESSNLMIKLPASYASTCTVQTLAIHLATLLPQLRRLAVKIACDFDETMLSRQTHIYEGDILAHIAALPVLDHPIALQSTSLASDLRLTFCFHMSTPKYIQGVHRMMNAPSRQIAIRQMRKKNGGRCVHIDGRGGHSSFHGFSDSYVPSTNHFMMNGHAVSVNRGITGMPGYSQVGGVSHIGLRLDSTITIDALGGISIANRFGGSSAISNASGGSSVSGEPARAVIWDEDGETELLRPDGTVRIVDGVVNGTEISKERLMWRVKPVFENMAGGARFSKVVVVSIDKVPPTDSRGGSEEDGAPARSSITRRTSGYSEYREYSTTPPWLPRARPFLLAMLVGGVGYMAYFMGLRLGSELGELSELWSKWRT